MKISEPGIYDLPPEIYHGDPTPEMSLSSSGARTLARDCPAVFWHQRQVQEAKRVFEIGTASHLMILEPERYDARVEVIRGLKKDGSPSEGYTSADAREKRDAARAAGKVPLLPAEDEMLRVMRGVLWADPIARTAFIGGQAEKSLFWRDQEFGIWCRTRPDYLPPHGRYLVDYKTSTSADPREFAKAMLEYGYHMQAAWYLDAVAAVTPHRPEKFAFVVQSKKPPHLVSVCWVDPEAIEIGRALNRYAKGIFRWCLTQREWPNYRDDLNSAPMAHTVNLPAYARQSFQLAQEAGRFEPPAIPDIAA
ncbi:PD-(D/E)XK nuclease-like domain-containing protein [Rhodovarius lipocyclicus]|uniref:PD-(D/E)XK nuclease-like domain-containing protein n=1 Tax=Rhodovarius lipocyclicus TaxID=268410 RepID=UPI001357058F|nr:PD-(D/E)XK nuclease-like domain-containing protein [Rhodovarius lipocyclicus]